MQNSTQNIKKGLENYQKCKELKKNEGLKTQKMQKSKKIKM